MYNDTWNDHIGDMAKPQGATWDDHTGDWTTELYLEVDEWFIDK